MPADPSLPASTDALPDPFTPGEVPRSFSGRVAELEQIRDRLGRVATFGETGGPPRAIRMPRKRLIHKGVIEPVGHGLVRFTMPGFGDYVRRRDRADQ